MAYNKKKLYKTLDYWSSRDMLILIFIKKDLEIFPYRVLYTIFREKCFSCYISLTDQISFHICVGNMCIAIICFPGFDVINFEINLIFLIEPFFYISKKLRQKFKYLRNKKIWFKKHFSSFLKGFWLPKVVLDLRVRL